MNIASLPAWAALTRHHAQIRGVRLDALFAQAPERGCAFCLDAAGLHFDYSKNLLTPVTVELLAQLAHERELQDGIEAMFSGAAINVTENRAALHIALRGGDTAVSAEVETVLRRMEDCVEAVASGRWCGYGGARITDVVNIGIGGSHLGPQLACEALRYETGTGIQVHFLANVDSGAVDQILARLSPATTLFIVASKSFTTPETALNAASAKTWITSHFNDPRAIAAHFVAISAHSERAVAFGIDAANVLPMWDWVGGRFSLWSAIGLPIAMRLGMDGFRRLLGGAACMDEHFRRTELRHNMPVMMALTGIWNVNFRGAESQAIVPYDDRLQSLPAYLQQLEMESNGKRVTLDNELSAVATAPVIWGGCGTNAQHAFFQLLHQGTRTVPVDFIVCMAHPAARQAHHDMLVANCLAQAEALMCGRAPGGAGADTVELARHRESPGNRPSNILVMDRLTPETLGALLALYEHKTFVQGRIWNVNSFDQWGVELGKQLAQSLLDDIARGVPGAHDTSTTALLERYLHARAGRL